MRTKKGKNLSIDKKMLYSLHNETFAFLADDPYEEYYEAQIKKATGLSAGGVNSALRDLAETGLILKRDIGKIKFYKFNFENAVGKQYKILLNVGRVWPFVFTQLAKFSERIVLFGSFSRGENLPDSDIDLYIVSREKKKIINIITISDYGDKMQPIIVTPAEEITLDQKLKEEIGKGIVLWEKQNDQL